MHQSKRHPIHRILKNENDFFHKLGYRPRIYVLIPVWMLLFSVWMLYEKSADPVLVILLFIILQEWQYMTKMIDIVLFNKLIFLKWRILFNRSLFLSVQYSLTKIWWHFNWEEFLWINANFSFEVPSYFGRTVFIFPLKASVTSKFTKYKSKIYINS